MMDMIVSKTPATLDSKTQTMFFTGTKSCHCGIYKMKDHQGKDCVATVQDCIRDVDLPTGFQGDCHSMYHGHSWVDFLRTMLCTWWNTEPYNQHKQRGEQYWRTLQVMESRIMDRTLEHFCYQYYRYLDDPQYYGRAWNPQYLRLLCFELYQEVYYVPKGGLKFPLI